MRDVTNHNFGLLIAYVLPGVTALWGASYFSPTVRVWLGSAPADAPTVGGFLYLTVAAIAAGLVASTVRWAVIDTLHHLTGIPRPKWDFGRLQRNISAFNLIVEHQYRFYQAYGNSLVSLVFFFCREAQLPWIEARPIGLDGRRIARSSLHLLPWIERYASKVRPPRRYALRRGRQMQMLREAIPKATLAKIRDRRNASAHVEILGRPA